MKKALPVKDSSGQIKLIYLTNTEDLVSRETTFAPHEWENGIARWEWLVKIKRELGEEWELVGNELKDVYSGFVYKAFFLKKDKITKKYANTIVEQFIKEWENQ